MLISEYQRNNAASQIIPNFALQLSKCLVWVIDLSHEPHFLACYTKWQKLNAEKAQRLSQKMSWTLSFECWLSITREIQ
jgi:hypothetical protein